MCDMAQPKNCMQICFLQLDTSSGRGLAGKLELQCLFPLSKGLASTANSRHLMYEPHIYAYDFDS